MATLLDWLGDRVKDVGDGINAVLNPKQVKRPQPRPQQQAPVVQANGQSPIPVGQAQNRITIQQPQMQRRPQQPASNPLQDATNFVKGVGGFVHDTVDAIGKDLEPVANTIGGVGSAVIGTATGQMNDANFRNEVAKMLEKGVVPHDVMTGKASPLEFGKEITKTGAHYAPYAMPGVSGGLVTKFGGAVSSKVANPVLKGVVNSTAQHGLQAAVAAPTFGGLDAGQQFLDTGKVDFNQSLKAGGMAAVQTFGTGVAGDLLKGAVKGTVKSTTKAGTKINNERPTVMANNHPEVQALDKHRAMLAHEYDKQTNLVAREQTSKAMALVAAERRAVYERVLNEIKREREGGFIKVPGGKQEAVKPTENFNSKQYVNDMNKAQQQALKSEKGVTNVKGDFKAKYIDDLAPIEDRLRQAQKNGAKVDTKNNISYQLDRSRRAEGISQAYVRDNGLDKIIQNVPDTKEFDQYLIARHAKELDPSITTGRNPAHDAALVKQLDGKYGAAAKELYKYNQKLLDSSVEYGLISKKTAAELKKKYPEYVPFNRIFNEDELTRLQGGAGKGEASLSSQGVVKKIEGSNREIRSPLDSILDKTRVVVEQGERNKAAQMLASYKDLPGNPFNLKPLRTTENVNARIDLYSQAKELKPAQQKLERILKSKSKEMSRLQTELDRLNKKGLDASLKKTQQNNEAPILSGERSVLKGSHVVRSGKRSVPELGGTLTEQQFSRKLTANETRKLVNNLVNMPEKELQSIKNKIAHRDSKLKPLLKEIEDLRGVVEGVKNNRQQMFDEARVLGDASAKGKSTISFFEDGVKNIYEVDKEIADAAKNMSREQLGLWGRIAAIPQRAIRGGATTLNVGFAGANIVKDVVGAAINSQHAWRIADPKAVGKALSAALHHNGKHYQELMREGVAGTSFDMYRDPLKSNVAEIRSHKNPLTRGVYNVTHPGQWYRTFENTIGRSEDFGRALQYYSNKAGYEKKLGAGSKEAAILAADQARNNSTNFFRHGSVGKNLNLAIPYWNAGTQGSRIQTRRIVERPVATLSKMAIVVAAPSAMIAMNNYSTPERQQIMDNIPQYEKDGNIIILGDNPTYNEQTNRWEDVYKFPVPPQHLGIHKTVQDAVRASKTGQSMDVAADFGAVAQNYTTINPTDARATVNSYTPQGLKLVAEPLTNTNFFTGNKIVPDSQKNLPAQDQYGDQTSGTAKTLGKMTNTSPRQIDNAIRTGFGGAGQNLVYGADKLLAATGAIDKKDVKGKSPVKSVTDRFVGASATSPSDKAETTFNELRKQVVASDEYKNASQYDKSRMLNRLETDVNAVSWSKSGKSDVKLTKKQQSLATNGFDKNTYTDLTDSNGNSVTLNKKLSGDSRKTLEKYNGLSSDDRKKWFNSENDAEYKYYQAKYENDIANGTLTSAQKLKAEKALRKDKVGADYSKNVRDLYGVSKSDLANWLATEEKGVDKQAIADQLLAYDRALYESGASTSLKYKYGIGGSGKSSGGGRRKSSGGGRKGGGGGRKGGSDSTSGKQIVSLTRSMNKIRPPKTTGSSGKTPSGIKTPQMKKAPLKKYTVTKTSTTKKSGTRKATKST